MITHKSSDLNNWVHQVFYGGYRQLTAFRHSVSGNNWSEWNVNYISDYEVGAPDTLKPKEYPVGVTTASIREQNAVDTPNGLGGILRTTKTRANAAIWTFQEFIDVTNNEIYTRRSDGFEGWREWKKLSLKMFKKIKKASFY